MKKKVISTEKVLKPKINNIKLTKEVLVTDENKKKIKMYRSRIKKANISINQNHSEVLLYSNND